MTCLAREGYSLALDVDVDSLNGVYFFVKDRPAQTVKRLKSVKLKHRTRVLSLRRKVVTRQMSGGSGGGGLSRQNSHVSRHTSNLSRQTSTVSRQTSNLSRQ